MRLASLAFAVSFGFAACAIVWVSDPALQQTASRMVSITQHGEGMSANDVADLSAQLEVQVAGAPNDAYVLKLAAQARRTLSDYAQESVQRVDLRHATLVELDKAIALSKPTDPPRAILVKWRGVRGRFQRPC